MSHITPTSVQFLRTITQQAAVSLRTPGSYIISPWTDWIWLISAPLWSLAAGLIIHLTPATRDITVSGYTNSISELFLASFITAHLFIVFVRTHLNYQVFMRFPLRFTIVPIALFLGLYLSNSILITMAVIATLWDVYHSCMQTFGIGRMYDMKLGNDAYTLRRLDIALNLLLYAGPIVGGITLMDHVGEFEDFADLEMLFLAAIPAKVYGIAGTLTWVMFCGGSAFLTFYLAKYWQAARAGYHVSPQKVILLASTGLCSLVAWGFNPYGEAFFIMNVFHAAQYFALVWWSEKKVILNLVRLRQNLLGKAIGIGLLIGAGALFGIWATVFNHTYAILLTVALLHFWYDGFIWSVRGGDV